MKYLACLILCTLFFYGCTDDSGSSDVNIPEPAAGPAASTPLIDHSVIQALPHDITLFTEGLLFHEGKLWESTGSPEEVPEARSLLGVIDMKTGKLDTKVEIDRAKYFGEGIVFFDGKLYQLTYKNQLGFIYDSKTFKQTGTFKYGNAEGWGLTTNGREIIMSDGTSNLTFLNPQTLQPARTLAVTKNGVPLDQLNELEYIKGFIYANVWQTNTIVKIDSAGKVVGELNLNPIAYEARTKNPGVDVMNGIAYDSATDKIYITGKLWANIYQIDFAH